jgi:hypothetical protein
LPTEKQLITREERKTSIKFRIKNKRTGEMGEFLPTPNYSIEDFILNEQDWELTRKYQRVMKHNVYLKISNELLSEFINMNWKILANVNKTHRDIKEFHSEKSTGIFYKNKIETKIPLRLVDIFVSEGWSLYKDTLTKVVSFGKYKIQINPEHLSHFLKLGWTQQRSTTRSQKTNPGCMMRCKTTHIQIKVEFQDVALMQQHGFFVSSTNEHERRRIKRMLHNLSLDSNID